jgi:hypothetical protein
MYSTIHRLDTTWSMTQIMPPYTGRLPRTHALLAWIS